MWFQPKRVAAFPAGTGGFFFNLSGRETQDNVSMHNFRNTLAALARQAGRGGIHDGEEG